MVRVTLAEAGRALVLPVDNPDLIRWLEEAQDMVDNFTAKWKKDIPDSVYRRAVITQMRQNQLRDNNPNGVIQTTDEGSVVYTANDPYKLLKGLLAPYAPKLGPVG